MQSVELKGICDKVIDAYCLASGSKIDVGDIILNIYRQ